MWATNVSTWHHVIFESGRTERFTPPGGTRDIDYLANRGATLHSVLSYYDGQGIEQRIERDFSFQGVRDDWSRAGWRIAEGLESVLKDGLEEVVKSLKKLSRERR